MTGKERYGLQRAVAVVPSSHAVRLLLWWHAQSQAPRLFIGLRVAALLISLTLLLAFGAVVRGAVREGEVRRAAAALRADAAWRCQSQHGPLLRDACLTGLGSALSAP